jgi:hypothetical protein
MATKIYESRENEAQALKSTSESTIGLIQNGELTYHPVNAFVEVPSVGDIVLLDDIKSIKYIKAGTYSPVSNLNPNGIPASWDKVGVVTAIHRGKALIVDKTNASKVWINGYLWQVTGWTLDSEDHTTNITVHTGTASRTVAFTYNAATKEEVAQQLTEFFNTNLSTLDNQRYQGTIRDGEVVIQKDTFSNYQQYTCTCSGLTVTNLITQYAPAMDSGWIAVNGTTSGYVLNVGRYIGQYGGDSSADRNPTSVVSSIPATPVSRNAYLGQYCQYLRDIYGDGDEGYYKYIAGYLPKVPCNRGNISLRYSGLELTRMLAPYEITRYGATSPIPLFPTHDYAYQLSYDNPQLSKGNWFVANPYEMALVLPQLTYSADATKVGPGITTIRRESDIINRSLLSIGGSALPVSTDWWTSLRRDANSSWSYYWYGNFSSYYTFRNSLLVPRFCLINI